MEKSPDASLEFWPVVIRGFVGHCPRCGHTKLFKSYLKQVEACPACGESFGHIRADDGPAWLTILLVGHILAPLMLAIIPGSTWPDWLAMIVWPAAALLLTLALLPRSKGLFIAVIWRMGCAGSK